MPELPDVELYKRHLDTTCRGRTIRRVLIDINRVFVVIIGHAQLLRLAGT